ncbi:MAG: glucose-1-phosphate cytidylyltransferase [Alphaproteobacteria bacterium]|nr:glucose-1-phosphate cytidylyltransferase [Alphaproteobacteria bacterium]
MKGVILAGGMGTRIAEETVTRPKPLVEIGGRPILWHIMKIYSHYGINDFVICLGYKGYQVKEYFANYYLHHSDVTFDFARNDVDIHQNSCEPWRVTLVDTGEATMTGGRLRRIRDYVEGEDSFCMTYGDAVSDIDIAALIRQHTEGNQLATITAVRPPARFGHLGIESGIVTKFREKPVGDGSWINGGFFVLRPEVIDYIEGDATDWERTTLQTLAAESQLAAFRHSGFWQCMDTLRDRNLLEQIWADGAPWKVWQ